MLYQIILFALLSLAGFIICKLLFKWPKVGSARVLRKGHKERESPRARLLRAVIMPLAGLIAGLIRLSPKRIAAMELLLKRGGVDLTPQEYYARAIVAGLLCLLLIPIFIFLGINQLIPFAFIFAFLVYRHFMTDMKDRLKTKKDAIEQALPGFIRSIIYKLDDNFGSSVVKVDIIRVFTDYQKVADPVFRYDIDMLITDLIYNGISLDAALRSFGDRVGIAEVSFLCAALIGIERGENQRETLNALARDMDLKAKENIRRELSKRPGKVKLATIPLVIVAIGTLMYTIVVHLFQSLGGLF